MRGNPRSSIIGSVAASSFMDQVFVGRSSSNDGSNPMVYFRDSLRRIAIAVQADCLASSSAFVVANSVGRCAVIYVSYYSKNKGTCLPSYVVQDLVDKDSLLTVGVHVNGHV